MTDWSSAVAILIAGAAVGAMFIYYVRSRPHAAQPDDLERRDLEAKRDHLVEQLRALDRMSADERTRLEIEAARVLRQLDEKKREPRKPSAGPALAPNALRRATLIGFAWGAGSMLALGGLGYFVMHSAKSREPSQGMTGGVTGGDTSTMRPATAPADPVVQQLEAAVQKSPDDLNARVGLAKAYLERDNLMGVFDQTQYVLAKSPNEPRALTYQALVRMAMGQNADAGSLLEKATTSDPNLIDAWVALAWLRMSEGKPKEAEAAIDEAARHRPEEKQRLDQVFAAMKQQAAQRQQAPPGELPQGHPAVAAAPAGEQPAQGAVHIALDVSPAARAKGVTVFVFARAEGVTTGPPIAVKRLTVSMLPANIDLSAADSMMGQPLPPKMRIEARVDSDGNPLTRDPSDPSAVQDGVAIGSSIRLKMQ